jgi:hypothetical protein
LKTNHLATLHCSRKVWLQQSLDFFLSSRTKKLLSHVHQIHLYYICRSRRRGFFSESLVWLRLGFEYCESVRIRVARFFLVQYTKMGVKYTKLPQNIPDIHRIYQMAVKRPNSIKYTSIFHCKTLQKLPKLRFLVWKYTLWQPWSERDKDKIKCILWLAVQNTNGFFYIMDKRPLLYIHISIYPKISCVKGFLSNSIFTGLL